MTTISLHEDAVSRIFREAASDRATFHFIHSGDVKGVDGRDGRSPYSRIITGYIIRFDGKDAHIERSFCRHHMYTAFTVLGQLTCGLGSIEPTVCNECVDSI